MLKEIGQICCSSVTAVNDDSLWPVNSPCTESPKKEVENQIRTVMLEILMITMQIY